MKKFITKFSPLLVNLMIGSLSVFLIGEILLVTVMAFYFSEYTAVSAVGFAAGYLISVGRFLHMYWETIGTFLNEESRNMPYFSAKSYAVRNGITMMAWLCIYYFSGQACMLAAIVGTIVISKVTVFMQPFTDKFIITKIFK